jgi:SAM-dependent methyltransferase
LRANPTWHEEDAPWKAARIVQLIEANKISPASVAEVGCGVGEALSRLHTQWQGRVVCKGYDIAPEAYRRAKAREREGLSFYCEDFLKSTEVFDLLLIIDVLEHIPDAFGFATRCRDRARYKIYHIPLEVNVLSVLRASFAFPLDSGRNEVGHLHFFTAESALLLLHETGHKIIDLAYTDGGTALAHLHPSIRRTLANVPRRAISYFSRALASRLLGGFSLLVLCE